MLAVALVTLLLDKLDGVCDDDRSWRIQKRGSRRPAAVIGCPGVDKPGRRRECTVLQPLYPNLPAAWLRVATVNLGTIEIFKLFLSKVKFTSLVVKMNSFS